MGAQIYSSPPSAPTQAPGPRANTHKRHQLRLPVPPPGTCATGRCGKKAESSECRPQRDKPQRDPRCQKERKMVQQSGCVLTHPTRISHTTARLLSRPPPERNGNTATQTLVRKYSRQLDSSRLNTGNNPDVHTVNAHVKRDMSVPWDMMGILKG